MGYLYFALAFSWCCLSVCLTFLFCSRVLFMQKVEKVDPVNVIRTEKKVTALKRIKQDEMLNRLLENG